MAVLGSDGYGAAGILPAERSVTNRLIMPARCRQHAKQIHKEHLTETDLLDAVVKVFGAAEDFDLDAHEVDGQIAPVEFRETDRVFLRGDNGVGLAFFAAVDDVQYFLLAEPVMVGEALGIDQLAGEFDQALLEALRLGNAAERGDFPSFEPFEVVTLPGEHVLEVERVMHAL